MELIFRGVENGGVTRGQKSVLGDRELSTAQRLVVEKRFKVGSADAKLDNTWLSHP